MSHTTLLDLSRWQWPPAGQAGTYAANTRPCADRTTRDTGRCSSDPEIVMATLSATELPLTRRYDPEVVSGIPRKRESCRRPSSRPS